MTGSSLWRHRDFRRLWLGETVSLLGTQVTLVAMPLVALKVLRATTFQVGALTSVERLPFLLIGLPAGAVVDRLRRRPVLIAGDVGRALILGSVPIAYWAGALTLAQIYVVVFAAGALTVFFDVAYQSYLPALVSREQLVEGNAKLQVSDSGASIVGPAIAGFLYQAFNAGAIVADALSYVWSAVWVLTIRAPEEVPAAVPGARLRSEIAEGLRFVLGHPLLRPIAACTGLSNLFGSLGMAVYFTYAVRHLDLSAGTIGLIFALGSLGFLGGALIAQPLARRIGVGPTIVSSAFFFGPPAFLIPLAPRSAPFAWLVVSWFVVSVSGPIYNITQVSLRQTLCPLPLQGRMNATMRFLVWGTFPIGAFAGGVLGSVFGLPTALYIAAGGATLSFLPVLFSPVRSLRAMPA